MIKRGGYIILTLSAALLFFFWAPEESSRQLTVYADLETNLLVPQRNIAVGAVDLKDTGKDLSDPAVFALLAELHEDFAALEGVTKVESLINAKVIRSEGDDIIVRSLIPQDPAERTPSLIRGLKERIPLYPELQLYVDDGADTLLYYISFGNGVPNRQVDDGLSALRREYAEVLPFDFTGRAPILAQTERLLTKDVTVFFPLLIILVMAVFLSFRNAKAIALSWSLMLLSVGTAYYFIHFLGMENSPLILLVPVFGMGLLSDYIIHYFYHLFYESSAADGPSVCRRLLFPLSLTVLSTLTGFLSLAFLDGTGHLQLGSLIAAAILLTFGGVFLWLPHLSFKRPSKGILPRYREFQIRVFSAISRHRKPVFILLGLIGLWGLFQLPRLRIEPYPIEQLPEKMTVKRADELINREFFGTVPYYIEVDAGKQNGLLSGEALHTMVEMHRILDENPSVGSAYSLLTVLKRINFFFHGSEDSFLTDESYEPIYPQLIDQYLLYYSSSVDPLDFESLVDASTYRYFSVKGLVFYKNAENLEEFRRVTLALEDALPPGWSMEVHGMIDELNREQSKLTYNWILSFLFGGLLIFLTVLIFYRNLRLALLSLVPALFSMVFSFGIIASARLSIDAFSIIFVAIITGLVIDYSIHTLAAIESLKKESHEEEGYAFVVGYSGIPILLSFLTSLFSFSVLFLSSFKGARNLGVLLVSSLLISYFLSMFLLPLLALPHKNTKNKNEEVNPL